MVHDHLFFKTDQSTILSGTSLANRQKLLNIHNKKVLSYQNIGKLGDNTGLEAVRQANITLIVWKKVLLSIKQTFRRHSRLYRLLKTNFTKIRTCLHNCSSRQNELLLNTHTCTADKLAVIRCGILA